MNWLRARRNQGGGWGAGEFWSAESRVQVIGVRNVVIGLPLVCAALRYYAQFFRAHAFLWINEKSCVRLRVAV